MIDTISKLKKIFGLPPAASDAALIASAQKAAALALAAEQQAEIDSAVNQLIYQSAGALDRKRAISVLKNRGAFRLLQLDKQIRKKT